MIFCICYSQKMEKKSLIKKNDLSKSERQIYSLFLFHICLLKSSVCKPLSLFLSLSLSLSLSCSSLIISFYLCFYLRLLVCPFVCSTLLHLSIFFYRISPSVFPHTGISCGNNGGRISRLAYSPLRAPHPLPPQQAILNYFVQKLMLM